MLLMLFLSLAITIITSQGAKIRYIEYRLVGNYKCLGKGKILGSGTYDILLNITIHPSTTALEKEKSKTLKTMTSSPATEEMLVDTRYASLNIKTSGVISVLYNLFSLLITTEQVKYVARETWIPQKSLYEGVIAVYVPPEILNVLKGQTIFNQSTTWFTKVNSNTRSHVVMSNNQFIVEITASTKHFYLRTIQQYVDEGWLTQATIYVVTTINISPDELPFIYRETIQATLIIQAQIKAEKSNIIYVPENPLQVVQQYIGAIIITIIIVLIVVIKKKLLRIIKDKICR